MGTKHSQILVTPAESEATNDSFDRLLCDPCINLEKVAKGWCSECNIYLCFKCMQTHAKIHKIATGRNLPLTRPRPKFLNNDVMVKQVTAVATLQDLELSEDETIPKEEKTFKGCVCINDHYVTISNKHIRLYDTNFMCVGEIDFVTFSPNSICHLDNRVVVSFDRLRDDTLKGPLFQDVQIFKLKPPNCLNSDFHLVKDCGFNTEGECFSTGICPFKDKDTLLIAVGLELDDDQVEHDIKYKIQILKTNGRVMHNIEFNPRGEPNFEGRFFICGSMKFGELCITELRERRVRGVDIKTGKTIYEFEGGFPQGVTIDRDDNLYVYNDAALYWIPTLRNKIYYMLQNYNKKSAKKETNMKCAISFDNPTRHLYITNAEKETIEVYKIT